MIFHEKILAKQVTGKINRAIEMLLPPIIADRMVVACLFNFIQGRGFRYIDPMKDPANFPRGRRAFDCTPDQLQAVLDLIVGKCVLDVGCGSGSFVKKLGSMGFQAMGIDPQVSIVEGKNWCLQNGYMSDFDFPKDAFDTLLSLKTLEHIPDAKATLSFWRTLAKHRIILLIPCQRYRRFVYDGHINFYPDEYQLRMQLGLQDGAVVKKIDREWLIHEDL